MVILRNILASLSKRDRLAQRIYDRCVAAARAPEHYRGGHVADSVDGRFGLLVLHLFLAIQRLDRAQPDGKAMVQALIDCFVRDMERNLREMGAGDIGVAKNVKQMAQALNGQLYAYQRAVAAGPEALRETLLRNVVASAGIGGEQAGGETGNQAGADSAAAAPSEAQRAAAGRLTGYAQAQMQALAGQPDETCLAGRLDLLPAEAAYRGG